MKIITSKKYANTFENYDPYRVDFQTERAKAKGMETESLFGALKDAVEASQVSVNEGKYYDQASVYRKELQNRGISFEEQNEKIKGMPSLHTSQGYDEQGIQKVLSLIFDKRKNVDEAIKEVFGGKKVYFDAPDGYVSSIMNRVKQDPRYLNT